MELKPFSFNFKGQRSYAARRPTQPSPLMISGETITGAAAAERLGISRTTFDTRRKTAIAKLKPGEVITWEMLSKSSGRKKKNT